MANIEELKIEYEELLQQLSNPELISDWEKFQKLQKRKGIIEKIIEKEKEIEEIENKIKENQTIISAQEDSELVSLAETEILQLKERKKILEKELAALNDSLRASLVPSGREESSSVIVEIRAGTGGEEAALFVTNLFKMYSKYAQSQLWQQKVLDSRPTELGGFKEIIFELKDGDV